MISACCVNSWVIRKGFGGRKGGAALWIRDNYRKTWMQVGDYRDSDEGWVKNSGRQAGRSHLAIKFCGDEFGPKDLGLALARRWFEREKHNQQEARHKILLAHRTLFPALHTPNLPPEQQDDAWFGAQQRSAHLRKSTVRVDARADSRFSYSIRTKSPPITAASFAIDQTA
jgi:hypothetical protein